MVTTGQALFKRMTEERCNELLSGMMGVIELIVEKGSRFDSARKQTLNIVGDFRRGLIEDVGKNYKIESLSHETILVGRNEKEVREEYNEK